MSSGAESRVSLKRPALRRGEAWALAAALGYALYQVFLGAAVQGEVHNVVAATAQAVPVLLFATAMGWFINRQGKATTSPFSDWRLIGALVCNGLLLFVAATPLMFESLRKGGVLITSPVSGTQVLFAALLAALLLREPFTRKMALGMMISVVGICVLAAGQSGVDLPPRWWLAVPFALGTAVCWALAGVLLTYTLRHGVDAYQAVAIPTIVGLAAINGYLLAAGQIRLYGEAPVAIQVNLLIAGVLSAAALISLTIALNLTTVASATTLNSLQVAIAPVIAWLFLAESLTLISAVGILTVLAGVIIVQRGRIAPQQDRTGDG
jgi:drug/metabolite transporter (DMT)-like permease